MQRISPESNYVLVYAIEEYELIGHLIEPHIVLLTSEGNLSLQNQRIHINNAELYDKALEESDYDALRLLSECTPEALTRHFSTEKRVKPKDFFSKISGSELIERGIKPYVQDRIAQVIQLIQGKPLYIKKGKNATDSEVTWSTEPASILFHLRRNEDNTHYFITVKYQDFRISINTSNSFLLSSDPCYFVSNSQLYYFDEAVDGNKVQPFLRKKFIQIPRSSEEDFLKNFMAPVFEKHSLYAKGYEVETDQYEAVPIVRLSRLLDGSVGFTLHFKYGEFKFPFHSQKRISIRVEPNEGTYRFRRIRRSAKWELNKKNQLEQFGLGHLGGSEFNLGVNTEYSDVVPWLVRKRTELENLGFQIEQSNPKEYSLESNILELNSQEDGDWFDIKGKVILGGVEIPFSAIRDNILDHDPEFILPNGQIAIIPESWFSRLENLVAFSSSKKGIRLHKHHFPLLEESGHELSDRMKDPITGSVKFSIPDEFRGSLRPYQEAGFQWLANLKHNGIGGCLADDMGLGKTVQTLAFLTMLHGQSQNLEYGQMNIFESSGNGESKNPSLLIVPTSLVYNWLSESEKFSPSLRILNYTGQGRNNQGEDFRNYDVILSTYGTIRNDIEMLESEHFETVILDEAQMIKNPGAKTSRALNKLQASAKFTLSGTPLENSVLDLWSQLNFTNKGLLGNRAFFQKKFQTAIESRQDVEITDLLHKLVNPFILRRTKEQVAHDLPVKTEQIIYCDMDDAQRERYEEVKSQYRNQLISDLNSNTLSSVKFNLLAGLTKLRLLANALRLEDNSHDPSSGKMEELFRCMDTALSEGHKILVFSQFVRHLDLVGEELRVRDIDYAYIDGKMSKTQRQKEVLRFQEERSVSVFLLSLKAGAYGLNLTEADYVFILDPWWNPSVENQAVDRTHRIGQTQKVFSYKFVTRNSIEEKILKLQRKKLQLSDALIRTEESFVKSLNTEEVAELLS